MALVAWLAGCPGCTLPFVLPGEAAEIRQQVQSRPLIVGFEGLQPFSGCRAHDICKDVAESMHMAASATSGNCLAHAGFIREADRHHQPVYLVGYSMGGSDALQLAQWCKLSGIPVRILFLLDPAMLLGRVPDNVASVVMIRSDSMVLWPHSDVEAGSLENPAKTRLEVVNLSGTSHTYLPYEAVLAIRARAGQDQSEHVLGRGGE